MKKRPPEKIKIKGDLVDFFKECYENPDKISLSSPSGIWIENDPVKLRIVGSRQTGKTAALAEAEAVLRRLEDENRLLRAQRDALRDNPPHVIHVDGFNQMGGGRWAPIQSVEAEFQEEYARQQREPEEQPKGRKIVLDGGDD